MEDQKSCQITVRSITINVLVTSSNPLKQHCTVLYSTEPINSTVQFSLVPQNCVYQEVALKA